MKTTLAARIASGKKYEPHEPDFNLVDICGLALGLAGIVVLCMVLGKLLGA